MEAAGGGDSGGGPAHAGGGGGGGAAAAASDLEDEGAGPQHALSECRCVIAHGCFILAVTHGSVWTIGRWKVYYMHGCE